MIRPRLFSPGRITLSHDLVRDLNYFYAGNWRLAQPEINKALSRHVRGDWSGYVSTDKARAAVNRNPANLALGLEIFSVHRWTDNVRIAITMWILTEAEDKKGTRHHTRIMMPFEIEL